MLQNYFSVLLFISICAALGIVLTAAGYFISIKRPEQVKREPYECGFEPFETARIPFDVRFYLVAILFIIFDLETAFFFPWAVALRQIGWLGFCSMMLFLGILVVGFIYEWKKGALEWE